MKINAYVYALFAIITWGTLSATAKLTLESVNFVQLLLYVGLFSTLTLFLIVLLTDRMKYFKSLKRNDYFDFAIFGFIGLFLYNALFLKALDIAPVVEVTIINYLWPLMIVIFSALILKEKLSVKTIVGILLGFVGAYIVISKNLLLFSFTNLVGDLLAFGAAVSWGLFSVLSKTKN